MTARGRRWNEAVLLGMEKRGIRSEEEIEKDSGKERKGVRTWGIEAAESGEGGEDGRGGDEEEGAPEEGGP